ncbi:putative phosphonate metabolism protein [Bradyrhizobium macuxiense]|uniref:Putative phosphonate metabolism protein n=2 Tax=Bradyrhizobium macuxiense TaxID=1755647 RepID=A0A560MGC1_9BRAD|nr:putative phosphonate metabolism protein [Bradyrhizobium macuxiense]
MYPAMANTPRYAIYYAPSPDSALHRFGSALLGYDAVDGDDLPFPDGVTPDWREVTEDPRKYGFHATLKAPTALADGRNEAELLAACAAFAGKARRIPVIEPVVDAISGFIAVIPAKRSDELQQLAADCVTEFDTFRAPLTPEDRARRKPERLTERQRDYLDRWGYPYVMEEFRFHMTLTGRLSDERRGPIVAQLRERFATIDLTRLAIDRIALFKQADSASRFRIIDSWPLRAQ